MKFQKKYKMRKVPFFNYHTSTNLRNNLIEFSKMYVQERIYFTKDLEI